jgi:heptosyltransferase-2
MKNKILIVGPAWVGDMVMAQCLFKLLKQRHPDVIIDVLAPAWSQPLLARMPEVSSSIMMPIGHGQFALAERYRIGKALRGNGYTQAIVLANSFKSALIPFFAKIPLRTGWRRELRQVIMNDARRLNKTRYPLMIERFMALGLKPGEALPKDYPLPELQISSESCIQALTAHQLKHEKPVLALCPGAEFGPAKRWPEEYYADIANVKLNEGWDVWIFGSPKDSEVAGRIMELTQQRCIDLTGKTKLPEAVDLLSLATVVVSNDSGLMHISAALKKPLIVTYGPTSASFTPPLHSKARVLTLALECQPCFERECPLKHQKCMRDLSPQKVLIAMQELIQ